MKITKRDIKIFFMGLITFFIIDTVVNWDDSIKSFEKGFNSGLGIETKK